MAEPLIRMARIRKAYGRVTALDGVDFHVNEREIVGLLGDNGAGKSTLIKVLSGAVPLTSGDIFVRGKKVNFRATNDAIAAGIETIYQDSALVTQLSIARNLFLGREPLKGPRFLNRLDQEKMNGVARDLLRQVGITKNIPPTTPIGSLSGGERPGGGDRPRDVFRQRPDHPRRADQQSRRRGDAGRALLRPQRARQRPFLHLHRPQHPPRLPGRGPDRGHAAGEGGRRRHRPRRLPASPLSRP